MSAYRPQGLAHKPYEQGLLLCHDLNSVQETIVYKFHDLCQLKRSAEARSNARLVILNFQQLFESGENICQLLFLEMEERGGCVW